MAWGENKWNDCKTIRPKRHIRFDSGIFIASEASGSWMAGAVVIKFDSIKIFPKVIPVGTRTFIKKKIQIELNRIPCAHAKRFSQ